MSTQQSDEDGPVPVDAELVRRLVAAQFPQWADLPVRPVEKSGVDNATYRLGDRMSVRLPRFPRWERQVVREQRWLPELARQLPLRVPEPLAEGAPAEGYPFAWSVYRWLDGDVATPENLADERRTALDLAAFFAALQRVDPTDGPPPEWSNGFRGVPLDDTRYSPVVEWLLRSKLDALAGHYDVDALQAIWDTALAAPPWAGVPVWIHGDPAPGNLLSRDGRLSAVIDFGTLAVGDPACDLIAAWRWFPSTEARDLFREKLGVDDATWVRGRCWGLASCTPDPDGLDPAARARLDALVADLARD